MMYDDMGGSRSPVLVFHGGVAAYPLRVDTASWTYSMGLHASPGQSSDGIPLKLEDAGAARDFWLQVGVAIFA
jgi:hypothetical protein